MPDGGQNNAAGRDEILSAATDMFAEAGFDAVSVSAIAQRAGTSKANVFHHFGSKEALYLHVMRTACGGFSEAFEALTEDSESFAGRLITFMRRDLELLHAQPDRAHLIMREVLESGPGRGRTLATEVFGDHFDQMVALFREGQAAGAFSREVTPEVAAIVLSACNVFMFQSQHVLRHLPGVDFVDDPERYAALVGSVLLDGVRGHLECAGTGTPAPRDPGPTRADTSGDPK